MPSRVGFVIPGYPLSLPGATNPNILFDTTTHHYLLSLNVFGTDGLAQPDTLEMARAEFGVSTSRAFGSNGEIARITGWMPASG